MSYSEKSLNEILEHIVKKIDISKEHFDQANNIYKSLGEWVDGESQGFNVKIYPQGSLALGTLIKPINDRDEYDLDSVCELERDYDLTAEKLKNLVKSWLQEFSEINSIEEKKRCWHVDFTDIPNFHMDVVPAYKEFDHIKITDQNEQNLTYNYIGSNPKGYIDWFYSRCKTQTCMLVENYRQMNLVPILAEAEIERLKPTLKTPLHRAVQLMKRHRDVMFNNMSEEMKANKPISIIITTLAGRLYNNEENILDAICNILNNMKNYIVSNKRSEKYYIENPSFSGENFADKWNTTHPERADVFFNWIDRAKSFFNKLDLMNSDKVLLGERIKNTFGKNLGERVLLERAESEKKSILTGQYKVDPQKGMLSETGIISVMSNHHYGENS